MTDDMVQSLSVDPRSLLLEAASKQRMPAQELVNAVQALEQLQQRGNLAMLDGEWRLVWTSGTQQYQNLLKQQWPTPSDQAVNRGNIIQRVNADARQLETLVDGAIATLCVSGPFEYSDRHRLNFTFSHFTLQLRALPTLRLPMGSWAKGWLQTTYLDDLLHIERGDRGGVSVYIKL